MLGWIYTSLLMVLDGSMVSYIYSAITLRLTRIRLQQDIGTNPYVEIGRFECWSTTQKTENLLIVKPTSLEEVKSVIRAAAKNKLKIRCSGSRHSWSPLFPDEGNILMYTKDIQRHDGPRIELLQNPDGSHKVNVMSGVTVEELMDFELENDVNLPCNVILTTPTYGGIIAAGCHGVGWNCMALSDYCTQMRIVDSSGELRTFSKQNDLDMMLAVQCNLGLFGVIYDMHLEVMGKKIAHVQDDFSYSAGDLFYDPVKLKRIVTTTDSVEIFHFPFNSVGWIDAAEQLTRVLGTNQTLTRDEWDPRNDKLWIRKINFHKPSKKDPKELINGCYYKNLNIRSWLEGHSMSVVDDFIITFPQVITPLISRAAFDYLEETTSGDAWQPLANAIHYRPNIELFSVHDIEVVMNVEDDFSNITRACQVILELVRQEAEKARFPLNVAMEMRWMKYSEAYLCPANIGNPQEGGSGHTVYLEILSYSHTPTWKEFAAKVASELVKIPGLRFHWAKEWDYVEDFDTHIQKLYDKQIKKFCTALDRSGSDPDGMFRNKRLQQLFMLDKSG